MTESKAEYVRQQGQTRPHTCHWAGCTRQVPPAMWGCKEHWMRLPRRLRERIWATYIVGQEIDMTPSDAYLDAAVEVERWIAAHGGEEPKIDGRIVRGLTLHRPWPWAFTHADKFLENRTWPAPRTMLDQYVALHAGKRWDQEAAVHMSRGNFGPAARACPLNDEKHPSGVIVALGRLVVIGHHSEEPGLSPWAFGPWLWEFKQPLFVLQRPVPCNGAQGLWVLPDDVFDAVRLEFEVTRQVSA
jgi:hypothetical protein